MSTRRDYLSTWSTKNLNQRNKRWNATYSVADGGTQGSMEPGSKYNEKEKIGRSK